MRKAQIIAFAAALLAGTATLAACATDHSTGGSMRSGTSSTSSSSSSSM